MHSNPLSLLQPPRGWWKCHRTPRPHFRHLKISWQNILPALPICGPDKWFLFLYFHITLLEVLGKLPKGDDFADEKEDKGMIHLPGNPWQNRQSLENWAQPSAQWQRWPPAVPCTNVSPSLGPGAAPPSDGTWTLPLNTQFFGLMTKPASWILEKWF